MLVTVIEMMRKCQECGGRLAAVKRIRKGIAYSALRCVKCGLEIMALDQAASFLDEAQRMKTVTFSKWGQAVAIRIPVVAVRKYGIAFKEKAKLLFEKDGFKVIPL